ncbi:MAG: RsbR, positive regulator of sigma-B [Labilithrix sp.]|nr:RsbR, positive regulator of sigma-B [Labilithrix sp.]
MTLETLRPSIDVAGFRIEWDLTKGLNLWGGTPTLSMWLPTTTAGLMAGMQKMVGTERFNLCLQTGGLESIEGDWAVIGGAPTLDEGMALMSNIAGAAGWGRWEIASLDRASKTIVFRTYNEWEALYQKALGVCWGSAMMAGKLAGLGQKILGVPCWTEQTKFAANGDPFDEFLVQETQITPQERMRKLVAEGNATGEDLRDALARLEKEVAERIHTESELRDAMEQVQRQREALQRAETPIIQVWEGVLALPIIGLLTGERATQMMEMLLEEIVRTQSRFAILDLTGVDVVDTGTADQLTRICRSVELLGAQSVVTGAKPSIAQTIAALGLDLSRYKTMRTLEQGLRYCISASNDAEASR